MHNIFSPTEIIQNEHIRWKDNRTAVAGQRAVKKAGQTYLPKPRSDMSLTEYRAYLKYVSWYPAVSRIVDGIVGLMLRKVPVMVATGLLSEVRNVITSDGRSVDELTRDLVRETLITNYTGLLVDKPMGVAENRLQQLEMGLRPYLAMYPAESILEVRAGVVRNRRVPVYVRLLEEAGTRVRELSLNSDGFYQVVIYTSDGTGGVDTMGPMLPTDIEGRPFTEIPFVLVSTHTGVDPQPAPIDHSVGLNYDHYLIAGLIATLHLHQSCPMLIATGVDPKEQEKILIAPGQVLCVENAEAKIAYVEPTGQGLSSLEASLNRKEDQLSVVGARILAPQKAVAEAAETEALRQGAENATLATLANAISRRMEQAFNLFTAMTGDGVVQFQVNTDFLPTKADGGKIKAMLESYVKGAISLQTYLLFLRDAGEVNETLKPDEEKALIAAERAQGIVPLDGSVTPDANPVAN